jgi:hypothetical protein
MARIKRQPMLAIARNAIAKLAPDLRGAQVYIHLLDGPPDSPRYAAMSERCCASSCPHGIAEKTARAGKCPVFDCPLRQSVRMLLNRDGSVQQVLHGSIHWL